MKVKKAAAKVVKKKKYTSPYGEKTFRPYSAENPRPKCYDRTPYSCAWCDLKFENGNRIDVHVLQEHAYNCSHCIKQLDTWDKFLLHAKDCKESKRNLSYFMSSRPALLETSERNQKTNEGSVSN
jgi:hypothetical protein